MNSQQNAPSVKVVKPINFLFHRTEVNLSDLVNQIPVARQLFKESVRLDLHPSGPIHWHYIGFTGDPSRSFTLEVCLPVASIPTDYDGPFHFKRTEDFRCVSLIHEGSWQEIPKSYAVILQFMNERGLLPGIITRELYINADFNSLDANVTEIQMGVAGHE